MNINRKQKLIEALKIEKDEFFKRGHSLVEHNIVIEYLETGLNLYSEYQCELLDAVINDFDTVCLDYGC